MGRPKWSLGAGAWFATALLLLSLSSSAAFGGGAAFAASTALAASSASQNCNAVLWLLHEMQTAAPNAAPSISPLRANATSILREYSLEAHQAAFLSGTRTNSYLE
jgi:hypothetical protein